MRCSELIFGKSHVAAVLMEIRKKKGKKEERLVKRHLIQVEQKNSEICLPEYKGPAGITSTTRDDLRVDLQSLSPHWNCPFVSIPVHAGQISSITENKNDCYHHPFWAGRSHLGPRFQSPLCHWSPTQPQLSKGGKPKDQRNCKSGEKSTDGGMASKLLSPLVWIILMTLPTYSYRMTRLHWAMSMPSSATEVAIKILWSPLLLNASSTHFCAGRVIPVAEEEGVKQLTKDGTFPWYKNSL